MNVDPPHQAGQPESAEEGAGPEQRSRNMLDEQEDRQRGKHTRERAATTVGFSTVEYPPDTGGCAGTFTPTSSGQPGGKGAHQSTLDRVQNPLVREASRKPTHATKRFPRNARCHAGPPAAAGPESQAIAATLFIPRASHAGGKAWVSIADELARRKAPPSPGSAMSGRFPSLACEERGSDDKAVRTHPAVRVGPG